MVGCDCQGGGRAPHHNPFSFQDLVANGALVSICNKYGEMPVDKAKAPLRELLRERAEKMGQNLNRIPYKDTFWKGTTRTRPRNGTLNKHSGIDFKQLNFLAKLNENHSGEVTLPFLPLLPQSPTNYLLCTCFKFFFQLVDKKAVALVKAS